MAQGAAVKASDLKLAKQVSGGANFAINTIFWIYTLLCVVPLITVIVASFTDENTILINGYSLLPEKWSLGAYKFLLEDWQAIMKSYGYSIILTICGTVVGVSLMALYAYPISRKDYPYRNFFSFFMFFTILFSGGLVPFYLVYTQGLHLQNTLIVLMMPLFISGFFVLLIRTFFANSIPKELYESAKIDGAGEWRIFVQIVLPLSLPVLATVGLFTTLNYWNDWFLSMLFINDNESVVSIQFRMYKTMLDIQYLSANAAAYSARAANDPNFTMPGETARMAMAVVGIGPVIFAYPFFQRFFVEGLTVGAVKG
ncbi:carbohydrate ABC transporter permease [Cohnella cholangitidis]|uniref:Carbohydrate ABC transporter permease n=1 Tax=Cohnella cholangitidis TaxID=2598458 RepID=A0A7G5BWJ2_9BACL|nr:carbohydrate ABC transporter permease [Cohnella cholangitidis]QMV41326.1 carbohydrate ABC transporter permease [Cohnella cholangitidis]